jgi:hypothetical protein
VLALVSGWTLPFHLGLLAAIFIPFPLGRRSLAVKSQIPVPAVTALLVLDIALNPTVDLFGVQLVSIHKLFFHVIPGFDGLRSEHRIVVLLPVLLSMMGAVFVRRFQLYLGHKGPGRKGGILVLILFVWAFFDAQPMWQAYQPLPRTDRPSPVLDAAAKLPAEAVLAVVKARGQHIVKRTPTDANYWLGHIMLHNHRQITGYSTYNTPASQAIEVAAGLREKDQRLFWVRRLAYLFGGTHLIIDWRENFALPPRQLEQLIDGPGGATLVSTDAHMALIDIGHLPDTEHGPTFGQGAPGSPISGPKRIRANFPLRDMGNALDADPSTTCVGLGPQTPGQWVEIEMNAPACVSGIGFSPGLAIWTLPTGFAVEVDNGGDWQVVAQRSRWEIPMELVLRPTTGKINIVFDETDTRKVRIRLINGSPWRWSLASFDVYECPVKTSPR